MTFVLGSSSTSKDAFALIASLSHGKFILIAHLYGKEEVILDTAVPFGGDQRFIGQEYLPSENKKYTQLRAPFNADF